MPLRLYDFGPSRCLRIHWVLQELGLPFETIPIDLFAGEHRRPEFLAINPAGKLPVLVDGDTVLTESVAIALYLAEKCPEKSLIPADLGERAQMYRWLQFIATELEQPLWRMRRHTAIYPVDRRLPGDVALAAEEFTAMARVLEAHMTGRDFIAGTAVSVADLIAGQTLDWAKTAKMLDGLPVLDAYLERLYARPHAPMRLVEALARVGLR